MGEDEWIVGGFEEEEMGGRGLNIIRAHLKYGQLIK